MGIKCAYISILFCFVFAGYFDQTVGTDWVTSCDYVLQKYAASGLYPVNDCYDDTLNNLTWWRVDKKLAWIDARQVCTSAGNNADLAIIRSSSDQQIMNDLYAAKVTMQSFMWIGITRNDDKVLTWVDGSPITQKYRWYPYPESQSKDCAVMLILSDPNGDTDGAGTFWYTEDCEKNIYVFACRADLSLIH